MSLLNISARALHTNQVALETTGHNIANVNTRGYSRQTAQLVNVQGQYTGNGYIGKGVEVETILRSHSDMLTRQSALAGSASASDMTRLERLNQLQDAFAGGENSLGGAIGDMMSALSDVANAPTDMTARTVALARMSETAARFRTAAERIQDIEYSTNEQIQEGVTTVNTLVRDIAKINETIRDAQNRGQPPNDLLDQRDELVRQLNEHIYTTEVEADDGTLSLFTAGGNPLVLAGEAGQLQAEESLSFPGSGKLALQYTFGNQPTFELNESMLNGGSITGLLRFANNDLAEGRNLLGRMAQAMSMTMNEQHKLGLTLDGVNGKDLFDVPTSVSGYTSSTTAAATVDFTDPTQFAASDYEVRFGATPPAGYVVRLIDGETTSFANLTDPALADIDGLTFNLTAAGSANERILFKPFASTAANLEPLVFAPRDLAMANPINAAMGTSNSGTLQLAGLKATDEPNPPGLTLPTVGTPVVFTFDGTGGFTLAGNTNPPMDMSVEPPVALAGPPYAYTSGQKISVDGWEITLKGTPKVGDTVSVGNALDPQYSDIYKRNAGNASAMMDLRDVQMFDNVSLQDGWASAMSQVGTRTQSAEYAAKMSASIADNLENNLSAVSGVNLDEEAAKLIQFQQAYQASAKMLQTAQNIFDSLIQTVS